MGTHEGALRGKRGGMNYNPAWSDHTADVLEIEAEAAVSVPMCPSKQKEIIRRP